MQGALPPAPPASPRNSRGATPCQAINFDIFRHIERECSQGFKGGDFRRKYYPSLDGTERHTALAEGKATRLSLLPHGECGVWGNAPRVKFRDGVRPPFSKGEEDWGLPPASEYPNRKTGVAGAGLSPVCGTHQQVHKVACMGDGASEPEMKKGGAVSPAFFGVLGAKPLTSGGK